MKNTFTSTRKQLITHPLRPHSLTRHTHRINSIHIKHKQHFKHQKETYITSTDSLIHATPPIHPLSSAPCIPPIPSPFNFFSPLFSSFTFFNFSSFSLLLPNLFLRVFFLLSPRFLPVSFVPDQRTRPRRLRSLVLLR